VCCTTPSERRGVPVDARTAASLVRAATRAALAAGHRTMLVDVLASSMRRDARTFDSQVHCIVVAGLAEALAPALAQEAPSVLLVMAGPRAALDVQQYFAAAEKEADGRQSQQQGDGTAERHSPPRPPVEIAVLGAGAVGESNGAVVIVDPPARGEPMLELRRLVRAATAMRRPVVVLNHPQPGCVHEVAQCSGSLPIEMMSFRSVFTLAPFALRIKEGANAGRGVARFVLMHVYPGSWQLWLVRADAVGPAVETPGTVSELLGMVGAGAGEQVKPKDGRNGYDLCQEWKGKPSDESLSAAVNRASKRL
jgi:hypothetical protein